MLKIKILAAAAAMGITMLTPSGIIQENIAHSAGISATLNCDSAVMTVNGEEFRTQGTPFLYKNNVYVPVDDILKNTGFTLGWDSERSAVSAVRDEVCSYIGINTNELIKGGESFTYDAPTLLYKDVLYMPLVMYAELSDASIYFEGTPETIRLGYRDLLTDTTINDSYRLPYQNVGTYKAVTIVGTMAMELLMIPDESARNYAATVNAVAAAMPETVNVYNIAIPTSCEFYAPQQLYTNQLRGIKNIYAGLDERVTPINAVRPLMEHAAEKLYFSTDHHWTQRGAYYVYREYAEICGFDVPPLESFEKNDSWSHVGSFAAFTKGTYGETILRSHPELLEHFLPKTETAGAVFTDMYMTNRYGTPLLVNTANNSYSAFAGGDGPVTRFVTGTNNGRRICIIKESFGNAFATWAANNYEEIYIIDPREFNGFNGHYARFNLKEFWNLTHFDDLVIINYPGSLSSSAYRSSILNML